MQFLQRDRGGELYHHLVSLAPALWDVSPTPTVTLLAPDGVSELLAEQDSTPGPSTTVGAAGAEAEQLVVPVASTAGMVVGNREQYVIGPSAALGQWEWCELRGVGSGEVRLRRPLRYAYASGDTFRSARLSVQITGSEVPTVYEKAQARWEWHHASQPYTEVTHFSISIWNPRIPLTSVNVLNRHPQALNEMGDAQDLDDLLADLWDELLGDLAQKVPDPGRLVSGVSLRKALLYKLLTELPTRNHDQEQLDRDLEAFNAEWEKVCQQTPVDADGSGTISSADELTPASVGRLWRA